LCVKDTIADFPYSFLASINDEVVKASPKMYNVDRPEVRSKQHFGLFYVFLSDEDTGYLSKNIFLSHCFSKSLSLRIIV